MPIFQRVHQSMTPAKYPASAPGRPASRPGAPRPAQAALSARPATSNGYNKIFVGSKGLLGTSSNREAVVLLPGSRWPEHTLPALHLSRSPNASYGSNHAAHDRIRVALVKTAHRPAATSASPPGYRVAYLRGRSLIPDARLPWDKANSPAAAGQTVGSNPPPARAGRSGYNIPDNVAVDVCQPPVDSVVTER